MQAKVTLTRCQNPVKIFGRNLRSKISGPKAPTDRISGRSESLGQNLQGQNLRRSKSSTIKTLASSSEWPKSKAIIENRKKIEGHINENIIIHKTLKFLELQILILIISKNAIKVS